MNNKLKDQALKACIEIYEHYEKFRLAPLHGSVYGAWKIGKRAGSLNNKKLKMDAPICTNLDCNPKGYARCIDFNSCEERTT